VKTTSLIALAAAAILAAGAASARDQIRIVGSSTVFPFSTAVAEQFGKSTQFKTPVVESTGTGGGIKLFCAGVGTDHPDIANASRRMKASEFKQCQEAGVTDVTEAKIGFDGIVVANAKTGATFNLTIAQIWTALAEKGPKPTMWNEVDPSLPAIKIEVLGPPPSSGTRDAFEELGMIEGCKKAKPEGIDCAKDGKEVRKDGAFVEAGENDNLIVSKLVANPNALGVFGYSFLDANSDKIKGSALDGVEPTFENIAAGKYELARSLYFYIKGAHSGVIPGLMDYVGEFTSEKASGQDGYLADKGLIPLPEAEHSKVAAYVQALTKLKASDLK
jgi:phosphate transport system substrate-binding protein